MYEIFPALVADDSHESSEQPELDQCGRLALIGGFLPRRCGIATFTTDMHAALRMLAPEMAIDVYAMAPAGATDQFDAQVCSTISDSEPEAFLAAAQQIEASGADVIWLQHEFGLFGGPAGDMILDLLDNAGAPVIITLHTVLAQPDPDQLRVMNRLIARASKLVVMSDLSRSLLMEAYGADEAQIALIGHGVPDRPFGRSAQFKDRFGFSGKKVILTFGLLSQGKGIEVMIQALPQIVSRNPDALYCIAGATHPNLVAHEGEAYRESLQALARAHGVEGHIHWIDAFLDTPELLDLIEAADVFVTPYIGAQQSTSGTLSYAMALGKAIVSTPYAHAAELLADGHGRLVPFGDSDAMASEISQLLADPECLHGLQQQAYGRGRDMIWPRFARQTLDLIEATRVVAAKDSAPERIGIRGLMRMCDSTGILQHSIHGIPDRRHGYCVDDNARALMLMHRLDGAVLRECGHLTTVFASFVQHAWNPDRREFRNFMGFERNWLEAVGSEDSCGRTLWAIGITARHARDAGMRRWACELFANTAESALGFQSPRAIAFAMLGAASLAQAQPKHVLADAIVQQGAERLQALHAAVARPGWNWFEDVLAYDNCRLSEAMLRAGVHLGNDAMIACGLETLEWMMGVQTAPQGHFRPVGSNSFGQSYARPKVFDQQPVEIWATIDAVAAAWDVTRDPHWLIHARRAYDWFDGHNDRSVIIGDPLTGTSMDGINPRGPNLNEGAESVLAYQHSFYALQALMAKVGVRRW
ncbi:glycosyltransferase family 4 protein [Blastomonas sp. AAP53]|uniref:glycosyltransferase family 4 protein n=1 Tax=Blastomonas sp. AAP53 TaxID=1248760 RepID=UPI0002F3F60A|nr:glycosyltransferase family 4 protein [Blastomonas sp. AAP53]